MKNKKLLFLALFIGLITLPFNIYAKPEGTELCKMISNLNWITWWIGGSAVGIGWAIAGILYLTAGGGERLGTAKKALIAAIIGTVVIVLSGSALSIVQDTLGYGNWETCEIAE